MKPPKNALEFSLFSGGMLRIDYNSCRDCSSQACIKNCVSSTLDPVLRIENGVPVLARPEMKPESGWCVECLACELDCALYGHGSVTITFPDRKQAKV